MGEQRGGMAVGGHTKEHDTGPIVELSGEQSFVGGGDFGGISERRVGA